MSDNESDTTIAIEVGRGKSSKISNADVLSKAREVALKNRRTRQKDKLAARLAELRAQLGDVDNEQLERVVKHLINTEDHHRSKLLAATEKLNDQMRKVNDNIQVLSGKMEHVRPTRMKALSELSSVSESTRKG